MKGESKSEVPWPRGRAWVLAVAPRLRDVPCVSQSPAWMVAVATKSLAMSLVRLHGPSPAVASGGKCSRGKCSRGVPQALTRLSPTLVSTERGEKGRRGGDGGMAENNYRGWGQVKPLQTPRGQPGTTAKWRPMASGHRGKPFAEPNVC